MPENGAHFSGEGHLIEAVILGDPNKTVIPVVCDSVGRLIIDLSSSTITIGEVDQGLPNTIANAWPVEITDGVNVLGTTLHPLVVTGTVTIAPSSTALNLFATNDSVPFGIETTILSYTPLLPFSITQMVGWGTYDGEFLIRVNGIIVGGGRTSAADRTLDVEYESAPVPVGSGQTILVTILEYGPGLQQFRTNLLGQ